MSTDQTSTSSHLQRTATALETAKRNRDQAILDARRQGFSVRAIAADTGVSPQTVLNIINRTEHHQ